MAYFDDFICKTIKKESEGETQVRKQERKITYKIKERRIEDLHLTRKERGKLIDNAKDHAAEGKSIN